MEKEEKYFCPICGAPTRVYMGNARKDRLCGKHADELKSGAIIEKEGGVFVDAKTGVTLNKDSSPKEVKAPKEGGHQHAYETGKCIACGKPTTNGFFFCPECYRKYKEKSLLVVIKNCTEVEILDESYEGKYHCDDGHVVKSKSEVMIDNYLFENGIPHAYEKAFPIDDNPDHDLHPDFYLPNFRNSSDDVYIEHWGYDENNIQYTKTKKYKLPIYRQKGITLICTNEKDITDFKTNIKRKLDNYKKGSINGDN